MRPPAPALLAGLVLLLLGAGCRRPAAVGLVERRDGLGRLVRLPPPERLRRLVSLAPSSTEILFALGAGDRIVGVDRYSDFPAATRQLTKVGADVDPNLERILALHPDAVLTATSANNQRTAEALERLGLPVYVSRAESLEQILDDVVALGGLLGRTAEAGALVSSLRARLEEVAVRRRGGRQVPTLVAVWTEPLVVAGGKSHVGDLLRAAGGDNVAGDAPQPFPTYSVERLLARRPEVVVVGTHADHAPPAAPLARLAERPGAPRFRIVEVDGDLLFRPGPRVVGGVEALAEILHPGAATDGGAR